MREITNYTIMKVPPSENKQCCYSVYRHIGSWGEHGRCERKTKEVIQGYGFCKQHSIEVKKDLGLKIDDEKFKFLVGFRNDVPYIQKFYYVNETKDNYKTIRWERVIGDSFYDEPSLVSKRRAFDTLEDAIKDARDQYTEWITGRNKEYQKFMIKTGEKNA